MPGSSPRYAISFLLDVVSRMHINYDIQGPLISPLYDGASRRTSGEVLTRRTSDGDPGGLPPGSVRSSLGGLRLRSGGADRRMGVYCGTSILLSCTTATLGIDPVATLHDYVRRRDHLHGAHTPLFLRADSTQPTRSWFERHLAAFLPHSDYGSHSARAGGATHYASLGLSEPVIMAIRHWSSKSWTAYLRDHPTVRAELELRALRLSPPVRTS